MTSHIYKILGEISLIPTLLLLLAFTFGEVAAGEIGGLQHLLQLLPLLILGIGAWFYPKKSGFLIICGSILLFCIYLIDFTRFPFQSRIVNGIIIFGPPTLAGYFFSKSATNTYSS